MRRDRARTVRRTLVGVVVVVIAAVVWGLYTKPSGQRAGEGGSTRTTLPQQTTVGGLVLESFEANNRKIELRAESMRQEDAVQRLQGVRLTFPFKNQDRQGTATITSDECVYQAQPRKATFRGQVKVRTDDGLELDSEELKYRTEPNVEIRSEGPVVFRRGSASGSALMMLYREGSGIQLTGQVKLHLTEEAGAPTDIASDAASASREQSFIWFDGNVVVTQGARELRSQRLQLKMSPDMRTIDRAAAIEDVDLRIGADAAVPGGSQPALASGGGAKRVRCRRLNMVFGAKGVMQEASAANAASLEIAPRPGEPQERRRISGSVLYFHFDTQGRLSGLDTQSAGPNGPADQRRTILVSEPLGAGGVARRVESGSLHATFDAEAGKLRSARFTDAVAFAEPGRKAWAENATLDEAAGVLLLSGGEPRIQDDAQGSELRAQQIRLGTRDQSVNAVGGVRQTLSRRLAPGAAATDGPTVLVCRTFDYDAGSKTAFYRENALLRSGRDEIRAPLIRIDEPAPGARRLHATGGVASLLHPRPGKGSKQKEPSVVDARSRELLYEEKEHRAVYTGDAVMRQGDITTRSPEAIVLLTSDGSTIDRVLVDAPPGTACSAACVELRQGKRRASGERGTYTPKDETLLLTASSPGKSVVAQDVDRRIEGRSLLFRVGSDTIRVDGRDETRTEAVIERKEPLKP